MGYQMTKYLQKCQECKRYGLANEESKCRFCGGQLINPKPPKFSLNDKYGKYRIPYFKEEFDKLLKK
jgi:H/ACA ribonucleoprotein complex subunit 3